MVVLRTPEEGISIQRHKFKDLGRQRKSRRKKRASSHHCRTHSHLVIEVAQAAVALCGSVELCDLWDIEAVHELLPYGLAQAVAKCHAHPMLSLRVPNWLVQQVSADLTNVLYNLEQDGSEKKNSLVMRQNRDKNRLITDLIPSLQ